MQRNKITSGQFRHFNYRDSCCFMIKLPFKFTKQNPVSKAVGTFVIKCAGSWKAV